MPLSHFGEELLKLSGPVFIKQNAARSNFTVAQSRKGRRPMRVETMLKKEKDGALYKFTKAAMDAAGVEVVNGKKRVLSEEEAAAVARQAQEVPIRTLNQIGRALPAINEVISYPTEVMGMMPKMGEHKDRIPGGLADKKSPKDFKPRELKAGIEVELEHTNDKNMAKEIAMDHLQEHPGYYKHLKELEKKLEKTGEGSAEKYLPWYGAAAGGTGGALLGEKVVPKRLRGLGMVGGALVGTGVGLHSSEAVGRAIDKRLKKTAKVKLAVGEATPTGWWEGHLPWYTSALGGAGGAVLGHAAAGALGLDPTIGMIGGTVIGTGVGLHPGEMLGRQIDKKFRTYDPSTQRHMQQHAMLEKSMPQQLQFSGPAGFSPAQEKQAWAKLATAAGPVTQFSNVPYTHAESQLRTTPTQNKKRAGDAPSIDQSSRFGMNRSVAEWQNPESAIGPKVAALGRMIVSPTDTHPDRGEGIGPKRIGGEEQLLHLVRRSPDAEPITAVESADAYSRS